MIVRRINSNDAECTSCEQPVREPVLVTKRQKKIAHARMRGSSSNRGGRVTNHVENGPSGKALVAMEVVTSGLLGTTMEER